MQEARALAHPVRLRIIRLLFDGELTNRELAERLEADPATILHHVRTLVRSGFVEASGERRGARGAREVPYRSTGKSWQLDFSDVAVPLTDASIRAFVDEVAESPPEDVMTTRLALRLTRERVDEMTQRLAEVVRDYVEPDASADAEPWAVFVAVHRRSGRR